MINTNSIKFPINTLLINYIKNLLGMKISKRYNTNYFLNLNIKRKLCAE